jgi:AcrR family transcriptional regulator
MKQNLSIKDRDKFIRKVKRDDKAWIDPVHLIMGQGVGKKYGYKIPRMALMQSVLDDGLDNLDDLLTKAVDGDKETEAVLCQMASVLLYKLAETSPPPLKWFPKELAMLAASKMQDIADKEPERHRGTNSADFASRDAFIIKKVIEGRQDYGLEPTRKITTAGDSGCSLVAQALHLEERLVEEVWKKRNQFGVS